MAEIFMARPAKKSQPKALDKPVLRKKRSIKRRSERPGRGVHKRFMQEFDPELDPVKEKEDEARKINKEKECAAQEEKMRKAREDDLQKADIVRVEQATKAAHEKLEVALQKRQRAQTLMEYADLAAEWATMAMKIAQATRL